jgi:hypothetical protein
MCTRYVVVRLNGDEIDADNAGDLAAAVGCAVSDIPGRSDLELLADQCLCDFDESAFCAAFGYRYELSNASFLDELLIEVAA